VFDINPHPTISRGRVTSIGGAVSHDDEAEAALEVAGDFRLPEDSARSVIADVVQAVSRWRDVAARNHIAPSEQDRFDDALTNRLDTLSDLV
jgi:hypothetical protein